MPVKVVPVTNKREHAYGCACIEASVHKIVAAALATVDNND